MGLDGIEASLGLASALSILKQYQETGTLQGKISIARFLKTIRCQCTIHIENGDVTSCQLVDEQGFPLLMEIDRLIQIDQKRGPFEWSFHAQYSPTPSTLISNPIVSIRDDMILISSYLRSTL